MSWGWISRRADFYEKELSFQVSCSYGPGRYDHAYEGRGLDYPIGYVRWTETRNFEAVLNLMQEGRIDVSDLVSHRFAFEKAAEAYEALANASALGVLLTYRAASDSAGWVRNFGPSDLLFCGRCWKAQRCGGAYRSHWCR